MNRPPDKAATATPGTPTPAPASTAPSCSIPRPRSRSPSAWPTVEAIAEATGMVCDLRWPNDLMLDGKKCAGILVQLVDGKAIAGIGINVNHTEFPPDLAARGHFAASCCRPGCPARRHPDSRCSQPSTASPRIAIERNPRSLHACLQLRLRPPRGASAGWRNPRRHRRPRPRRFPQGAPGRWNRIP